MRSFSYITTSLIAIGVSMGALPAVAQTAVPDDADQGASAGLEEIIVTAQRRQERNQDVPISITAFSPERLQQQNVTTAQNLNGVVPSLQVSSLGQASREVEGFTLRGQGPTYQGASSVVVYMSEVPLPQGFTTAQQGGPGNYVDLENVQVLAGPQGTLFGRNTTGGAVLLVPHKPTNNYEGYFQVSRGNRDYVGLEGVVNIPVIDDKLLVRVSGTYQDRDGYTQDLVWNKDRDDMHYYAGRIGITFKPTERIENYLLAYGARSSNNGTSYIHLGSVVPALQASGACGADPTCAVYLRQTEIANEIGPRKTRIGVDQFEKTRTWGVINTTNLDLTDELTLRNIVSYQRYYKNYALDEDGTPLQMVDFGVARMPDGPIPGLTDEFGIPANGYNNEAPFGPRDNLKQFTEELQLQGKMLDNHLTFTVGGFYYNQKPTSDHVNRAVIGCAAENTGDPALCTPTFQSYGVSTKSKALYAQATLDLGVFTPSLENLRLTGGYRYTWDTVNGYTNFNIPFGGGAVYCIPDPAVGTSDECLFSATGKSKAPTWTIGADYKPMSNLLLFAKVSRGYKAGGFNPFAVRESTRTFGPEYVTSYEAGFKSDWRLGTVPFRLNITAYSSDYKGIQKSVADAAPGAVGSQVQPASARIRGIETEATIRPIPALELGGNVSYTDAEYKDYNFIAIGPTASCSGATVGAGEVVDASCENFGIPKWTYSAHASLDLPVPDSWGAINLYAAYSYISTQVVAESQRLYGGVLAPYGLLNLSARWKGIAQSNVDLELFMTNATNKLYRISNSNLSSLGFYSGIYGEPRMYGARLRWNFGK